MQISLSLAQNGRMRKKILQNDIQTNYSANLMSACLIHNTSLTGMLTMSTFHKLYSLVYYICHAEKADDVRQINQFFLYPSYELSIFVVGKPWKTLLSKSFHPSPTRTSRRGFGRRTMCSKTGSLTSFSHFEPLP